MGTHCSTQVLQQPEQRCTSTQAGHSRKLALDLSTFITSVRTLHVACWACCASTVGGGGGWGGERGEGGGSVFKWHQELD